MSNPTKVTPQAAEGNCAAGVRQRPRQRDDQAGRRLARIVPGLPSDVIIAAGERTELRCGLGPLFDTRAKGFRESLRAGSLIFINTCGLKFIIVRIFMKLI